jgi:hypothetical protein
MSLQELLYLAPPPKNPIRTGHEYYNIFIKISKR